MNKQNFNDFVKSYLTTAAWSTCEPGECQDFTREAKKKAAKDCELFIELVNRQFGEKEGERLLNIRGNDLTHLAAHDFWLTRNRHGAGFWDKEEHYGEENAKLLTTISHVMKEIDCYHVRGPKSKLTF